MEWRNFRSIRDGTSDISNVLHDGYYYCSPGFHPYSCHARFRNARAYPFSNSVKMDKEIRINNNISLRLYLYQSIPNIIRRLPRLSNIIGHNNLVYNYSSSIMNIRTYLDTKVNERWGSSWKWRQWHTQRIYWIDSGRMLPNHRKGVTRQR
jgi:hypothetical protein